MFLKNKRLSFKIGLLFAIVHLSVIIHDLIESANDRGALYSVIFDIFLIPLYALFINFLDAYLVSIVVFGILGTLCWFFIPIGIARIVAKFIRPKVEEQFK